MLDIERTYITATFDSKVVEGETIGAEGAVLVGVINPETGEEEVKCSTGTAGDRFVGISFAHKFPSTFGLKCDSFAFAADANTPAIVPLSLADTGLTEARITLNGAAVVSEASQATVAAGKLYLDKSKGILYVSKDDAGKTFTVLYRYTLSSVEQSTKDFELSPNFGASEFFGKIGVIVGGESRIFTDQYDLTADWSTAKPGMGAGGKIAPVAGNVAAIPGARIIKAPSAGDPLLGIAIV